MKNKFKNTLALAIICTIACITVSTTFSIFTSCSNDNGHNIQNKLAAFESRLKGKETSGSMHLSKAQYTEVAINNKKNQYNYEGELILKKHKEIEEYAEAKLALPNMTFDKDLKPFIIAQTADFKSISLNDLNSDEKQLLESFKKNFVPSVETITEYENFVYENYPDQSKMRNFLTIISRIKYNIFISDSDVANKRTLSGWESCVVQCMRHEYANYNVVNWIEFALNPGAGTLWTAASCGWDCRKDNYYGHD